MPIADLSMGSGLKGKQSGVNCWRMDLRNVYHDQGLRDERWCMARLAEVLAQVKVRSDNSKAYIDKFLLRVSHADQVAFT